MDVLRRRLSRLGYKSAPTKSAPFLLGGGRSSPFEEGGGEEVGRQLIKGFSFTGSKVFVSKAQARKRGEGMLCSKNIELSRRRLGDRLSKREQNCGKEGT